MGILDGVRLTHKEKVERAMPLPDVLNIYEIAVLWSDDKRKQDIYMKAMSNAFEQGKLKGKLRQKDSNDFTVFGMAMFYEDKEINKADFKVWLDSNDEVLPKDCLLINWRTSDIKEDKKLGNADKKRLESLRLFVAYVWNAGGHNGEPRFPFSFPCETKNIFEALQKWENVRIKNDSTIKQVWIKITLSTFSDFWKGIKERKEICTGISRGESPERDFFKNIKL